MFVFWESVELGCCELCIFVGGGDQMSCRESREISDMLGEGGGCWELVWFDC